jgi:hypothetical protein
MARNVVALGAGNMSNLQKPATQYVQLLDSLLNDMSYKSAAAAFAKRHADFDIDVQTRRVADVILHACG